MENTLKWKILQYKTENNGFLHTHYADHSSLYINDIIYSIVYNTHIYTIGDEIKTIQLISKWNTKAKITGFKVLESDNLLVLVTFGGNRDSVLIQNIIQPIIINKIIKPSKNKKMTTIKLKPAIKQSNNIKIGNLVEYGDKVGIALTEPGLGTAGYKVCVLTELKEKTISYLKLYSIWDTGSSQLWNGSLTISSKQIEEEDEEII